MCSRQNYTPNIILKPDQVITAFNMASKGMGATFIPDALVSSVPFDVPLCYYKMDDGLAIRNVYFYKKRNKYMTKAMEEFLKVSLGKNGPCRFLCLPRSVRRERIMRKDKEA